MRTLIFILVLFPAWAGYALDPEKEISHFVYDVWTTDNGLPQNSVTAVVQARNGYLWLGTQEGLVRFDGVRFDVFDSTRVPLMQSPRINALLQDPKGPLWIGTDAGLLVLVDGKLSMQHSGWDLPRETVRSLYSDSLGNLWIGMDSGALMHNGVKTIHFTVHNGLPHNSIYAIGEDPDGKLWIGTREGAAIKDSDKFLFYDHPEGPQREIVRVFSKDQDNNFWIGTSRSLYRKRADRVDQFSELKELLTSHVLSILSDKDGALWIGTQGNGLIRYNAGHFSELKRAEGLSNDFINSLCEDQEGNLWLGHAGGGLSRLKDGKFTVFAAREGLGYDSVSSLYESQNGGIWIGTFSGGVSLLKDGKITTLTTRDGLANDLVFTLFEDRNKVLWAGTGNGLSRYENRRFTNFQRKDGLVSEVVYAALEDREGTLWVGSRLGGLVRFRGNKFARIQPREGKTDEFVYTLYERKNRTICVGTREGLLVMDNNRLVPFSKHMAGPVVLSLYEDNDENLWAGTGGGGLYCLRKNGDVTTFTSKDGLFDDVIYTILEDRRNNLWMTSNKGIFRVSRNQLSDFAAGKISQLDCVSYGKADGMRNQECNSGQYAACKTRDGKLWFASLKGAIMVDPEKIKTNLTPPAVILEKILSDNLVFEAPLQKVNPVFPPGKRKFEFHYTGLNFFAPERVKFKVLLEGYDQSWVDAGTRRIAYYTSLQPGTYRFRVIAQNSDGVWNNKGDSVQFVLQPFFYQTRWFYGICFAGAVLVAFAVHRFRLRQLKAQFHAVLNERTRISRDLHDTLAQSLSGVVVQLDAAEQLLPVDQDKSRNYLLRARDLAAKSLREARQTVLHLRSEESERKDLKSELEKIANEITKEGAVNIHFASDGRSVALSPRIKENVLRIAEEAIHNSLKHAHPLRIEIRLKNEAQRLELCIRDDGSGFESESAPAEQSGHLGLAGMKERAKELSGELKIDSSPGRGTTVTLRIPLQ